MPIRDLRVNVQIYFVNVFLFRKRENLGFIRYSVINLNFKTRTICKAHKQQGIQTSVRFIRRLLKCRADMKVRTAVIKFLVLFLNRREGSFNKRKTDLRCL